MQKINLIAQSVLQLSHRENSDDDDDDDNDTHQGCLVRDGTYSVANKKEELKRKKGRRKKNGRKEGN